jgi:C-methyltransferase
VLRLLVSHGIFERDGAVYRHNDASALLRSDNPRSMRAFARMMGLPVFAKTWGVLDHSLISGAPAIEQVAVGGLWPYLQSHPDEAKIFNSAMESKAHADVGAVVSAYDFRPFNAIVDVAGGLGHLLRAVLDTAPSAQGILFELPEVIASLPEPGPRETYRAGDFFTDPLPRADCYLLMEIIHDWSDAEAARILRAIRRASSPGATVLILGSIRDEGVDDTRAATLDVIMLAVTGGRERTADELGHLLRDAGFRPTALLETAGAMRVLEATAV